MSYYAVIDTNILVSSLLSRHDDAASVQLVNKMIFSEILPDMKDLPFYEVVYEKKGDGAVLMLLDVLYFRSFLAMNVFPYCKRCLQYRRIGMADEEKIIALVITLQHMLIDREVAAGAAAATGGSMEADDDF